MSHISSGRPTAQEHEPYYLKYFDFVPETDILPVLEGQEQEFREALAPFDDQKSLHRYGPDKWTIREVLGHLIDTERVIGVKLLYALRHDATRLVWHDQDLWNTHGNFNALNVNELLTEFRLLRQSNLILLRRLDRAGWDQPRQDDAEYSPRALAYLLAGHIRYHLKIVQERYLPTLPT